ncbi:large conductance mechanosensitive channel protein MscL [Rhodothermus profundi]|uniref:Large-conductance mechanosensitive channel n=1 Tax=Rhodothermus profundi TaxID=633813 RepID=A0A1M6UGC2_9BACT|nr:large conductance mechanosensitive channel protein MscL [Rhodothermus profundi]SHK68193.1 large conductance mechanosensitive channel [Rhodothermus profundi]
MWKAFKTVALRGNVLDMALGIIIGFAFGAVVQSLVQDILMPPIGLLLGGVDFSNLFWVLREGTIPGPYPTLEAAREVGAVTLNVGLFLNSVVNFLIVGFSVILVVKGIRQAAPEQVDRSTPGLTRQEQLLMEIRDLLKAQRA